MTWMLTDRRHVHAQLADAVLADPPPAALGDITLLPHQRDAVARIRTAIRTHHGALLADDVGLGKTYTALAVASRYTQVHVIAPAALQAMWRTAITHAQLPHVRLHSVHGFSHGAPERTDTPPCVVREAADRTSPPRSVLVIIDEAHYLRTRRTARYAAVARFVSGCDTLLLSATPLHNRADELRHLLGLFLGARADLLSDTLLAQVVIRRTTAHALPGSVATPAIQRHHAHPIPHDRDTLAHILAIPAPLPAHDGAVAGALIRLGLLRAWCSSDAALTHAVRQRRLRGHALQQALRAGRHPTQAELRSWLVGEHDVQLAFPELMAQHPVEAAPLLDRLAAHLDALERLAQHHDATACGDVARADALRDIMRAHPDTPIIAFSQFTRTVHALHRALADIAGVGVLSSRHARIASGRISRSDALARFAPHAQERPPPPTQQSIRLLLSTDLLAEGVNLQDAGVVVHLDLPWTDALRTQRVGRCARIGSPHAVVHVYRFAPPPHGERALQLHRRLTQKARLAKRFTGVTPTHARTAPSVRTASAAAQATRLRRLLSTWRYHAEQQPPITTPETTHPATVVVTAVATAVTTAVATAVAPDHAWIAHIEHHGVHQLLCAIPGRRAGARRRVGTGVRLLVRAIRIAQRAEPAGDGTLAAVETSTAHAAVVTAAITAAVHRARRDIHRWERRSHVREAAGPPAGALSPVRQRVTRQIEQLVGRATALERRAWQPAIHEAMQVVVRAQGTGADDALARWSAEWSGRDHTWLGAWRREPVLAAGATRADADAETKVCGGASASTRTDARAAPLVVHALLLVGPEFHADYTSACHDTPCSSISTGP
ncbi:MAG: DEAD/DEAH box helicase [Gemmatimonadota bacterium]|nr:DEAD/DEAH box helicase [Gemmatimonadota bacterium]